MLDAYPMGTGKTQSKARSWRLTWLPYGFDPPTNNWEKLMIKN